MLGYGRDHFLNRKLCDVLPFTVIPACRIGLAALQTSQAVAFDHWSLEAQDKSLVDVEFVGSTYQVDRQSHSVIVLMIQLIPNATDIQPKYSTLVYQALIK